MYGNILVPLDGSKFAEDALPHAVTLAKVFGAKVTLVHVIAPITIFPEPGAVGPVLGIPIDLEKEKRDVKDYLGKTRDELRAAGIETEYTIREGDPASEIVDYCGEKGIDLVVMSTHGRSGIRRWVYGSVADRVLRESKCPVLLIRSQIQD